MKKNIDIVVTGIGVINPCGSTYEAFSNQIVKGVPFFSKKDPIPQPCGYITNGFDSKTNISPRKMRKMDRFTQFSIVAAEEALKQSKITITKDNAHKIGIIIGNSIGGWQFVEPQLYNLYQGNMDAINSYVATAWFPTAPQGEISIEFGIKGYSKTLSGGSLSGNWAIHHALDLLYSGKLEVVLVGSFETPLTPLVYNEFFETGYISPSGNYIPYSNKSDGKLLGEGGSLLVLEKYDHAKKRSCDPLAFISQPEFSSSFSATYSKINLAYYLEQSDYVLLDGSSDPKLENEELTTIHNNCADLTVYSTPKTLYGDLLSGNATTDIACCIATFENSQIIPSQASNNKNGTRHIVVPTQKNISKILVNASDNNGQCSTFCIAKNREAHHSWKK